VLDQQLAAEFGDLLRPPQSLQRIHHEQIDLDQSRFDVA